jgi:hypothetical protein
MIPELLNYTASTRRNNRNPNIDTSTLDNSVVQEEKRAITIKISHLFV